MLILKLFEKEFIAMIQVIMLFIPKNMRQIFLAVLLIKLCVSMIYLATQLFFTKEKNAINKFIQAIIRISKIKRSVSI